MVVVSQDVGRTCVAGQLSEIHFVLRPHLINKKACKSSGCISPYNSPISDWLSRSLGRSSGRASRVEAEPAASWGLAPREGNHHGDSTGLTAKPGILNHGRRVLIPTACVSSCSCQLGKFPELSQLWAAKRSGHEICYGGRTAVQPVGHPEQEKGAAAESFGP